MLFLLFGLTTIVEPGVEMVMRKIALTHGGDCNGWHPAQFMLTSQL